MTKYSDKFLDEHRDINVDHDWWDAVYEDFEAICKIFGITLDTQSVRLWNGKTREDPCIFFSGFWSQGDGASFSGRYATYRFLDGSFPADMAPQEIREHAPQDETLHKIADDLCFMRRWYGDLSCKIEQSGRCSMTMSVDDMEYLYEEHQNREAPEVDEVVMTTLVDSMRALADWLYDTLETEYNYLTSDEAVAETLEANEIEEELDEDEETLSHAA